MHVNTPVLGSKCICPECRAKYYDLGRTPVICPKCAARFDSSQPTSKQGRDRKQVVANPDKAADAPRDDALLANGGGGGGDSDSGDDEGEIIMPKIEVVDIEDDLDEDQIDDTDAPGAAEDVLPEIDRGMEIGIE